MDFVHPQYHQGPKRIDRISDALVAPLWSTLFVVATQKIKIYGATEDPLSNMEADRSLESFQNGLVHSCWKETASLVLHWLK